MEQINVHKSLDRFLRESTSKFDESHNAEHAYAVWRNVTRIVKMGKYSIEDWDILMYAALLHDVVDHKYKELSITEDELYKFVLNDLCEEFNDTGFIAAIKTSRIRSIIENISYSKERKGLRKVLPYPDNLYLDIVSDADRLEALGLVGIERCKQYNLSIGGTIDDVIQHCHDKLLKLLPDGFIRTQSAKDLAAPLHTEILNFVNNQSM